ncbi:MAG: hypothetical protein DHS20C16_13810 [Phycisphaerae bacterium]|nr:MAG: hypothetical protein DHS20C16_13810 [Phycisphaerae bacterium]
MRLRFQFSTVHEGEEVLLVVKYHGRRLAVRRILRCLCAIALLGLTSPWGCTTESAITPGGGSSSTHQDDSDSQSNANDDSGGQDSSGDVLGLSLDDGDDGSPQPADDAEPLDDADAGNVAPIADAGEDVQAESGDTIVLDGSGSSDPDGDELSFEWSQDPDTLGVLDSIIDGEEVEFVAPTVEAETVLLFTLVVSDGEEESSDSVSVTVSPAEIVPPCPPEFVLTAANTSGIAPFNSSFEVGPVETGTVLVGDWEWTVDGDAVGDSYSLVHSFGIEGEFIVEACLTTSCGFEFESRCESITINAEAAAVGGGFGGGGGGGPPPPTNVAPIAVATAASSVTEGNVVTLNGTGSSDPDSGPSALTYSWSQAGGTDVTGDHLYNATAAQPQFTAPAHANDSTQDTLIFKLEVSDGADSSPTDTVSISVTPAVITAANRTADLPDSWLVLYNLNSADSIAWKDWYIAQWNIPSANTLGLNADAVNERITKTDMTNTIFTPVVNHLNANPTLKAKVMGILVGYRVPGNFYTDSSTPTLQGGGGWSVSSRLQKLDPSLLNTPRWPSNAYDFNAYVSPDTDRLNKSELASDIFITARIDAPTLAEAQALTTRARAISTSSSALPSNEWVYIDYDDPGSPGGNEWTGLRLAYEDSDFNTPAWKYPWKFFVSDGGSEEPTPNAAFQFSYYRLTGWHNGDWSGSASGTKILGYAMNSWGATTVRSTTSHSGRFVPNLLFNGGYAGAIGATGEPYLSSIPKADTVLWCLADGRTMAEAVFQATPDHAWMWELVGDPLLRIPAWFDKP